MNNSKDQKRTFRVFKVAQEKDDRSGNHHYQNNKKHGFRKNNLPKVQSVLVVCHTITSFPLNTDARSLIIGIKPSMLESIELLSVLVE